MSTVAPGKDGAPAQTQTVVNALYDAFLRGDAEGMLSLFSDDVHVRFLGQADARGLTEVRRFFAFSAGLLVDVDFHIRQKIIDGEWAAVLWDETARTFSGAPWANHGVDVIHVKDGRITELHENNDARMVAMHLPRYEPGGS